MTVPDDGPTPDDAFRFTFDRYRSLLDRLREANARFRRFEDDGRSADTDGDDEQEPARPTVFLRHDVDWSPRKARQLAEIESKRGIEATYFFLASATAYNPLDRETRAAIDEIESRGHAVGVHVDLRDVDGDPDVERVGERIERERAVLAAAGAEPVPAVSFHNPPDWVIGRRLGLDGVVNAYAPRFIREATYRADSNQRWRSEPPLDGNAEKGRNVARGGIPDRLQLLTHPVLWGERDAWTVDRLREERDYHDERLARSLARTDRTWDGPRGLGSAFDSEATTDGASEPGPESGD